MNEQPDVYAPQPKAADVAHAVAKGVISSLPILGPLAGELFGMVITPELSRRKDEWVETIGDALRDLENTVEGFSVERLAEDPVFVSTLLQATQTAMRTHQRDKREALHNAVLNAATRKAPGEDLQQMFLHFIDTMTPWHLHLLAFADDPAGHYERAGFTQDRFGISSLNRAIVQVYPELGSEPDFLRQVWTDLHDRGLVNTESISGTMTTAGMLGQRTSEFGRKFLAFIKSPLPPD